MEDEFWFVENFEKPRAYSEDDYKVSFPSINNSDNDGARTKTVPRAKTVSRTTR